MKKLLLFLSLTSLFSCTTSNEDKTIIWVKNHKKPIQVMSSGQNYFNNYIYTLISADGEIFPTGPVNIKLPETISVK